MSAETTRRSGSAYRPPSSTELPRGALALERRGVHHGFVVPGPAPRAVWGTEAARAPAQLAASTRERWSRAAPIHLPGALTGPLRELRGPIRDTLAMFERMRDEGSFQDEVWGRLEGDERFEPAGVTVDLGDEREIEKVFANVLDPERPDGKKLARDVYAKLSWISHDERDTSLRIRFSFGSEALLEWQEDLRRAPHSDAYAEALFAECAALAANVPLVDLLETLLRRRLRFSERIVYSNAPGGGAVFHNDAELYQLGVVYGQLAGSTYWLAIAKRELAEQLAQAARGSKAKALRALAGSPEAALEALDGEDQAAVMKLLNQTPRFTRALVEAGHGFLLRPGDALLLPSESTDEVAWHSVFALGDRPSLAHSYGIFPQRISRKP